MTTRLMHRLVLVTRMRLCSEIGLTAFASGIFAHLAVHVICPMSMLTAFVPRLVSRRVTKCGHGAFAARDRRFLHRFPGLPTALRQQIHGTGRYLKTASSILWYWVPGILCEPINLSLHWIALKIYLAASCRQACRMPFSRLRRKGLNRRLFL